MAGLSLESLAKRFSGTRALDGVSLRVRSGEFIALLGPSGCGKTTLLRLIAGFEVPDAGEVRIGEDLVAGPGWAVPPEDRRIGMVFQSYALWPHMSVADNVAFALRVRGLPKDERGQRVAAALEAVGLAGLGARMPQNLSGGQRQRVALARCLAMRPGVILLDEPLANLDAHLREAMQREFQRLHRETGATFVYVTHDQAEAMALADRVAVMDRGRIEQVAPPRTLYGEPSSEMVARFVGGGILAPARVLGREAGRIRADLFGTEVLVRGAAEPIGARLLCLRPADLEVTRPESEGVLSGRMTGAAFHGAFSTLTVRPEAAPDGTEFLVEHRGLPPEEGARVGVRVRDGWLIPEASP